MEAVGDVCFSGASTIVCDCAASDKFVELAGDAAVDVWLCDRWIAVGAKASLGRQYQTIFGNGKGNCFAACVASLLQVPLAEVPNFCAAGETVWWVQLREWLAPRGLVPMMLKLGDGEFAACRTDRSHWLRDIPTIVGGKSPRGDFLHAVTALNGEVVHDPHPSGDGVENYQDATVFVATRPECVGGAP